MQITHSKALFEKAKRYIPGGVNSPVRAFTGVGGEPIVAASGQGAVLRDVDGNEYLDYILSWGPLVLGHAPDVVLDAVSRAMQDGTSFGMPTEREVELAEAIIEQQEFDLALLVLRHVKPRWPSIMICALPRCSCRRATSRSAISTTARCCVCSA